MRGYWLVVTTTALGAAAACARPPLRTVAPDAANSRGDVAAFGPGVVGRTPDGNRLRLDLYRRSSVALVLVRPFDAGFYSFDVARVARLDSGQAEVAVPHSGRWSQGQVRTAAVECDTVRTPPPINQRLPGDSTRAPRPIHPTVRCAARPAGASDPARYQRQRDLVFVYVTDAPLSVRVLRRAFERRHLEWTEIRVDSAFAAALPAGARWARYAVMR